MSSPQDGLIMVGVNVESSVNVSESKIVSSGSDEDLSSVGQQDDQLWMVVRTQVNTPTVQFKC